MRLSVKVLCVVLLVSACRGMGVKANDRDIQLMRDDKQINDSKPLVQSRVLQSQTNTTTNSTTTNNTTNNTQNSTTTNQTEVPQIQCQSKCSVMSYYNCTICYQICTTKLSGVVTGATYTMNTCTSTKCAKYKTERRYEDDPTSAYTQCSEWETQSLGEQECTQTCCNKPDYTKFTIDTWYSCTGTNTSKTDTNNLIGVIVGSVLGGLLAIVILVIVLCCCKENIAVKCKDVCWCCERLFRGKYVTEAMQKRNQSEKTKDTRSPSQQPENTGSAQQLDRSRRKWIKIQSKQQVSQLPTSKYIIQSQYQINAQIYCALCLDDMINCKTACGHSFHFECLRIAMRKKLKCPECDSKKFNPLKVICDECREKQTTYEISKKNVGVKHPSFYHEDKIVCQECLHSQLRAGGSKERL